MYRRALRFADDCKDIIAQFRRQGSIHLPLLHGDGIYTTISFITILMLDEQRMLVRTINVTKKWYTSSSVQHHIPLVLSIIWSLIELVNRFA